MTKHGFKYASGILLLMCVACGSSRPSPGVDAGAGGGGTATGGGAGAGGAMGGAATGGGAAGSGGAAATGGAVAGNAGGTAGHDWSDVDAMLTAAAADGGVASFGLTIWDADDRRVYERMIGGFTADTRVAVASASKMVSGLVIFDAIRRGELSLDATTGDVLGWTGANGSITLRHLLSFTSGLPPSILCTANPLVTLAACVDNIRDAAPVAAPGTRFDYGSTHLHVAARMAEVASGKTWARLFGDTLATPLGLPAEVAYFTLPKQQLGMMNPLVAGGLRASVNEYAPFLRLVFHRGSSGGLTVGTPALFDAQTKEPFPDVVIGNSPVKDVGVDVRYGLTAWLMCGTPAAGCAEISSPGAFGFTPWLDRATGYYAILSMETDRNASDDGVVSFAVGLQRQLAPLIRQQL